MGGWQIGAGVLIMEKLTLCLSFIIIKGIFIIT
jgi:hypothetical protein